MTQSNKSRATYLTVDADQAGRRLDNVLSSHLKDLPKTRIYRMIRKGEVRVNSRRVKQDYRLLAGDAIRIPPVAAPANTGTNKMPPVQLQQQLAERIIYQDDDLLALNKPAGMAVHSGSRQQFGVIEIMRALIPVENLELVHRLDKATSGCLLLAKHYPALRALQDCFRDNRITKEYLALLKGRLRMKDQSVRRPLQRAGNKHGHFPVRVADDGKQAETRFRCKQRYRNSSLVEARIATGRTHQIRVHADHIGHPVAGDPKYGDFAFNRTLKQAGLRRMFLHASRLTLQLPGNDREITLTAPLPDELAIFLDQHR